MFSLRSLFEVIETYVDRACYAPMTKEYDGPLHFRTSRNESPIDAHTYKNLPCHRLEFRKWRELAPACFQEEALMFRCPNTSILALKQHTPLPFPPPRGITESARSATVPRNAVAEAILPSSSACDLAAFDRATLLGLWCFVVGHRHTPKAAPPSSSPPVMNRCPLFLLSGSVRRTVATLD